MASDAKSLGNATVPPPEMGILQICSKNRFEIVIASDHYSSFICGVMRLRHIEMVSTVTVDLEIDNSKTSLMIVSMLVVVELDVVITVVDFVVDTFISSIISEMRT